MMNKKLDSSEDQLFGLLVYIPSLFPFSLTLCLTAFHTFCLHCEPKAQCACVHARDFAACLQFHSYFVTRVLPCPSGSRVPV